MQLVVDRLQAHPCARHGLPLRRPRLVQPLDDRSDRSGVHAGYLPRNLPMRSIARSMFSTELA